MNKINLLVLGAMVIGLCNCGDDGPETGETATPPPTPCELDFADCAPAIYNFYCYNKGPTKNHHVIGGVPIEPELYNACADVDPAGDWEDAARAACSARCQNISEAGFECKPENFSSVEPPVSRQTCSSEETLNTLVIEQTFGALAAADVADLPCDLWDDCSDEFSVAAQEALSTPPTSAVRYTADTLLETVPMSSLITVQGNAPSSPTTQILSGEAAYTAYACSAAACPIYLPQLELAANGAFSATISVGPVAPTVTKTFTDVEISLKQPTMGIWLPNFEYVIFPPDSLVFNVSGTVSGTELAGENGPYVGEHIVRGYVFGTLDGGLTISAQGEHSLVDFNLYAEFAPE
ncbi:hypothetical protein [Nannocystis pusilla]|uniref:hypothetical protein n=1 Tax=Nannocystis pusilla TaxID=889268 RepID=UPI003BF2CE5A